MKHPTIILWEGIEYNSLENCRIKHSTSGIEILSTILGYYGEKIFKVDYLVKTNKKWETLFLEMNVRLDYKNQLHTLEADRNGNWKLNGKRAEKFKGCIDIDISLTPFTNTLPINRLKLKRDESAEIRVIYFDILNQKSELRFQKYTCLSESYYKFQNVPNDFEAAIHTDEGGFVVDYPMLFSRRAVLD